MLLFFMSIIDSLQARDLIQFTQQSVQAMQIQTERQVRDLQAAELAHHEHRLLKAEIAARDQDFYQLNDMARRMVQANHYGKDDVSLSIKYRFMSPHKNIRNELFDRKNFYRKLFEKMSENVHSGQKLNGYNFFTVTDQR